RADPETRPAVSWTGPCAPRRTVFAGSPRAARPRPARCPVRALRGPDFASREGGTGGPREALGADCRLSTVNCRLLGGHMARKGLSRTTAEALGPLVVPLVTKVALPIAIESLRRGGKFDTDRFYEEAKESLAKGVKESKPELEELKEHLSERGA